MAENQLNLESDGRDSQSYLPEEAQHKKASTLMKVFGGLCLADGLASLVVMAILIPFAIAVLLTDPEELTIGADAGSVVALAVVSLVVSVANDCALVFFGQSLMRNKRRNAARWSYALIAFSIFELILLLALEGVEALSIVPAIKIVVLVIISVTVDPTLREERELQRKLRYMEDRSAAERGMLGRDETGEGYIKLNFFNLFWVFVVCCVLGLIIEEVHHAIFVVPGEYQDRAGLLFGPFSPIYGVGAVLMTIALNRLYNNNPIWIFLGSAVIGAGFEFLVSWFMQSAFGITAWNYSDYTLFGYPDPVAVLCQGRTSTIFAIAWGALGLIWVKFLLPNLLKFINLIPWKWRYSLTAICAVLMFTNAAMTLQALDCWFERNSGQPVETPIQQFYADYFDDAFMENRFQSMSINPNDSSRVTGTLT